MSRTREINFHTISSIPIPRNCPSTALGSKIRIPQAISCGIAPVSQICVTARLSVIHSSGIGRSYHSASSASRNHSFKWAAVSLDGPGARGLFSWRTAVLISASVGVSSRTSAFATKTGTVSSGRLVDLVYRERYSLVIRSSLTIDGLGGESLASLYQPLNSPQAILNSPHSCNCSIVAPATSAQRSRSARKAALSSRCKRFQMSAGRFSRRALVNSSTNAHVSSETQALRERFRRGSGSTYPLRMSMSLSPSPLSSVLGGCKGKRLRSFRYRALAFGFADVKLPRSKTWSEAWRRGCFPCTFRRTSRSVAKI